MKHRSQIQFFLLLTFIPLLSGCLAVVAGGAAAGASAAHDRRSWKTVLDDKNIQLTARDLLNRDKEIALKNNVSIVVYQGQMLLVGEVRTEALKQRAAATVRRVEGIRHVFNELAVQEPESFASRRRDDLITAHAKTALLDIVDLTGFDPTRVNVTTAHRVVYLMGLVNHEEAERVTEVVRNVNGVERVVKLFEYVDQ